MMKQIGAYRGVPVFELTKQEYKEEYGRFADNDMAYYVHDGQNGLKVLIFKGVVIGTVSPNGNVTEFNANLRKSWKELYWPIQNKKMITSTVPKEPAIMVSEVKIPHRDPQAKPAIAKRGYAMSRMSDLLAEGEAFRQKLKNKEK